MRADTLEVRVDNAPNYQILLGNVDRIRVAGRGVYVLEFLRIDEVDIETDPISIDLICCNLARLSYAVHYRLP